MVVKLSAAGRTDVVVCRRLRHCKPANWAKVLSYHFPHSDLKYSKFVALS